MACSKMKNIIFGSLPGISSTGSFQEAQYDMVHINK
jgi:hypothetical protein